jgi:hypothetical protein
MDVDLDVGWGGPDEPWMRVEASTARGEWYECATAMGEEGTARAVLAMTVWLYGPEDRVARSIALTYRRPQSVPPTEPERFHRRFPDGSGEVFMSCSVALPATAGAIDRAASRLEAAALEAREAFTGRRRWLRSRPQG